MGRGITHQTLLFWLNRPLMPNGAVRIWMLMLALVLLLCCLCLWLCKRRKKRREENRTEKEEEPMKQTQQPILEIANLQGKGSREEQQDSFGISPLQQYEEKGLLAILCDGMGGMAEGGMIAAQTSSQMLKTFPWEETGAVRDWICRQSQKVYRQFRGQGGTTLVAAFIKDGALRFWCVGDSDLFLWRNETLYALNLRQEFKNELALRALEQGLPVAEAYEDPQAGALAEYIGKETVQSDDTRIPFKLEPEDVLLLCSDGVSDTLTIKQIGRAMALPPQQGCERLEKEILSAAQPNQDNYTAILLKYHGKGERQANGSKETIQ